MHILNSDIIPITAKSIIDGFCLDKLIHSPNDKIFPNTYLNGFEADIFHVTKAEYLYEYEVKVSRSDFFADFRKKNKVELIKNGKRANYFTYIVPEGLIKKEEAPEYAGLIEVTGIYTVNVNKQGDPYDYPTWAEPRLYLRQVKGSPRLSKDKLGSANLLKLYESTYYRFHARRKDKYLINKL